MGRSIRIVPRGTRVRNLVLLSTGIAYAAWRCLWMKSPGPQISPQPDQASCPQDPHVFNRQSLRFQQGFTSSLSQGIGATVGAMESITSNRPATQLAIRLRSIGKLADRLDAGADPAFVLDVAKAIIESCSNPDLEVRL